MEWLVGLGFGVTVVSLWSVFVLFLVCLRHTEKRIRDEISAGIHQFVDPPGEGQPSPLAVLTDQMATLLVGRLMQQVKASMAGIASGESKELVAAAESQMAASSPWMYLLANFLPKKFRSKLMAVPQFTGQLGLFGKNGGDHPAGSTGSIRDRLQKGG